jgi:hypothetical protein
MKIWRKRITEWLNELINYLDGVGPVDNRPSSNKLHHFGQFHAKFLRTTKADFFLDFFVKTKSLTNFKHNSTILGDFFGFGNIFLIIKDLFDLERFWKMQCSEICCAFLWDRKTLKLNSIIKNISNFMNFIKKIQEKKLSKKFEFLTVFDTFGPYNQSPTWIL